MAANVSEPRAFAWTGRADRAAVLVAEDLRTDTDIAADVAISQRQLERWKRHPDFAQRVEHIRAELRAAVVAEGIANRQNRVQALNERWHRMQMVIAARAIEHADVPGGDTGLLVRQVKLVKLFVEDGEIAEDLEGQPHGGALKRRRAMQSTGQQIEVDEYALDTGLLKELREHEKQAAQELGQWTEKSEHTGELLIREYVGVDMNQV